MKYSAIGPGAGAGGRNRRRGHRAGASTSAVAASGATGEPELLLDPLVVPGMQALDGGRQEADAQQAQRSSPAALVARERSRTEYAHLSVARAGQVAREAFPEAIERPAGRPPQLPAGAQILRYISPNALQVDLPGGRHAVVESSRAIALETSRGHFADRPSPARRRPGLRAGRFGRRCTCRSDGCAMVSSSPQPASR